MASACPAGADRKFGPRIRVACRAFDFTFLFEDAFFVALPAAALLAVLPWRLWILCRRPVLASSRRLAVYKLGLLSALLCVDIAIAALRAGIPSLRSRMGLASDLLAAVAVLAASLLSFVEDQRSPRPSDLVVLYFSATAILSLPRLRSLWLTDVGGALRAVAVAATIVQALVVVLESVRKTAFLRPAYKSAAIEQVSGFWNRSFFVWLLPFFKAGYSKDLLLQDIPNVSRELEEEVATSRLAAAWQSTRGRHRLLRATFFANWRFFFAAFPPRLALSAFTFCQPFLIELSVSYLSVNPDQDNTRYRKALVGAFLLTYLGIAVSRALYWRQTYRMTAAIRAGLISTTFRHTVTLKAPDVKDSAALTLMGTDVERIAVSLRLIHEVWASIPEVAVAVWLLARHISAASVVPLLVCLAAIAAASRIADSFGPAQKAWVERVQARVAATAAMLSDIKAVKMLGLTDALGDIISHLRAVELKTSEAFRSLLTSQILVGNIPTVLAPFATFVTYAAIAKAKKDGTLLSAQAFTSLSLINLATNPIILFCQALPTCMQAVACFGRIEAYCLRQSSGSHPSGFESSSTTSLQSATELEPVPWRSSSNRVLVSLTGAHVSWLGGSSPTVLRELDLTFRSGFSAIVGPVASGKSTLLATLLGETTLTKGLMTDALSGVAFCPQTPWIMDDTIRRNIVGNLAFDEKWYRFAANACCLQGDLDKFPEGDRKRAGSNGASLSGGQRQRVALARAIYSRLPIVIMDDVTSGFDAETARSVVSLLFDRDGYFRKAGISVIVATHNHYIMSQMDSVVVLNDGCVADSGSFDAVRSRNASLFQKMNNSADSGPVEADCEKEDYLESDDERDKLLPQALPPGNNPDETSLNRRGGSWAVYGYYCRSAGNWSLILWASFTVIGAVATNYSPLWIQKWTDDNKARPNEDLGLYLGIYAVLLVISTAATAGECWVFFIRIINNTALKLHSDLLQATLRAPLYFFQATDVGAVANRFSQDMDLIDMTLPSQAIQFTTGAVSCAVQLIIICILGKYLAATIPALVGALVVIQRLYLCTSRQVRLLDIEAKAPLYKLFIETIEGVASIRAFRWGRAMCRNNSEILNQSQKPYYMLLCVQQWLALVLDLVVGALAVIIVALAMSLNGGMSAGGLGVSLVLVLQFNSLLTQTVQAWTKLETSIGAVARVQQFLKDTPSEPNGALPPSDWPNRGQVQFHELTASYGCRSSPVLKNLSLKIEAGEKVAVCGASGSGKSSLIMATLLMMKIEHGYVAIDGLNISTLDGRMVRSSINTVPQDPFFTPGTVRFNVDPRGLSTDEAVISALKRVGLLSKVESSGNLDGDLNASEWSQGERQLFCLARAMLVPSRILILDEAAGRVDEKTEAIMQDILDSDFREHTVISVLHRFAHIHRFDRVAVLDNGQIVECDSPERLMSQDSAFARLYRAHRRQH